MAAVIVPFPAPLPPLPRELPPSTLPWLAGEMRAERQRENVAREQCFPPRSRHLQVVR